MRSDQPGRLPQENPHGAAFQTPSLLLSDMVGSKQALSPASTSFSSTCYYDHQLTVCMSDAGSGQAGLYLSSLLLSQTGIQQKLKKELVPLGGQEGTQEKRFLGVSPGVHMLGDRPLMECPSFLQCVLDVSGAQKQK